MAKDVRPTASADVPDSIPKDANFDSNLFIPFSDCCTKKTLIFVKFCSMFEGLDTWSIYQWYSVGSKLSEPF